MKKSGPPVSPHLSSRKTQEGSMRMMRWLDDAEALGAVIVGEEEAVMFAAVLGLKQRRRYCLSSCL